MIEKVKSKTSKKPVAPLADSPATTDVFSKSAPPHSILKSIKVEIVDIEGEGDVAVESDNFIAEEIAKLDVIVVEDEAKRPRTL